MQLVVNWKGESERKEWKSLKDTWKGFLNYGSELENFTG